VDSMVALGVLAVGIVLIFSMNVEEPRTEQSYTIAEDTMNILTHNRIKNINDPYAGPNSVLSRNGNITDIERTLSEQIGEFYFRNQTKNCDFCIGLINNFLTNITQNLIPAEYNYYIYIDNTSVFNHSSTPISSATFIVPARAIVHGIYNTSELFGPYMLEVISWR